jgi:flavin reductase (DIM6/NTAB) family NADH-FMN oxidoreductase RutF
MTALKDDAMHLLIDGQAGMEPSGSDDAKRMFRNTLGHFCTGVTCMTTLGKAGEPIGMTASSFNSLSLDPPLILWSIANNSTSFGCFQVGDAFAVNVLAEGQNDIAMKFAKTGGDKFQGVAVHQGLSGVPLIDGSVVYFECTVDARHPGGDHDIIIGRVRRIYNIGKKPLLFHSGALKTLA